MDVTNCNFLDILEIFRLDIGQISYNLVKKAFATWQHAFLSTSIAFYNILARHSQNSKFAFELRWCQFWSKIMISEVEERPKFVTAGCGKHRSQRVNSLNLTTTAKNYCCSYFVNFEWIFEVCKFVLFHVHDWGIAENETSWLLTSFWE